MTGSRFAGGLLATLALAAAGIASGERSLFVAAAIPLAFVAYGALSTPRAADDLRLTRSLSNESPLPGDRVRVTLTVENAGDSVLPDVRVADGVPDGLLVADGAPSGAFALPAGETAALEYRVVADRGQFPFDAPTVRLRGTAGAVERTESVAASGADALDCRVTVADIPLRRQTASHAGTLATDTGGPGIEFHSTREYQHGDPVNRINWRRYAKTGELSTVNYRERRAAAVVLVVDARDVCDASAGTGTPSGASLSAYAAAQAVEPLEVAGHQVGLAVFGIDESSRTAGAGSDPAWVPPGRGDEHHARLATVLDATVGGEDPEGGDGEAAGDGVSSEDVRAAADGGGESPDSGWTLPKHDGGTSPRHDGAASPKHDEAASSKHDGATPPDDWQSGDDTRVRRLAELVPPGTQVAVCSPALDRFPVAVARRLAADGHRVTAVCPDVTATDTPGRTLAATERVLALRALRSTDAQVVDWSPGESLASAVARATTAIEEGTR